MSSVPAYPFIRLALPLCLLTVARGTSATTEVPVQPAAQAAAQAAAQPAVRGTADVHATVLFEDIARAGSTMLRAGLDNSLAPRPAPAPMPIPQMPVPPGLAATEPESGQPTASGPFAPIGPAGPTGPAADAASSPDPSSSFTALPDNGGSIPPDTHGAVGPSHLMVTLNTQVRIQNRYGASLSTVGLGAFWSRLNAPSPFDPKVVYDPYAQRWIFTSCSNANSAASSILMGVSQTSDPTRAWNLYRIDADPTDQRWADYPSIGFNKQWIVVHVNMFAVTGSTAAGGSQIYAFDKADLYANGAGNYAMITDGSWGYCPAMTYDANLSTMYLLQNWNGNSSGRAWMRLSTLTGAVDNPVLAQVGFVSSTGTFLGDGGRENFGPQLGSTYGIATGDSRMQNLVYRNGSLWAVHTAFLPVTGATRSAVQWWQFTASGSLRQWGRVDDPTGAHVYAFPSIAVNRNNDVLLGFADFSAAAYAAGSYAFRSAYDPAGTMRAPRILKAGEGAYYKTYGGTSNRWGDYSATTVDPTNDTDFWTIQEYARPNNYWGTWWGQVRVPGTAPVCATGQASLMDAGTVSFYGTVNPGGQDTTAAFEWGTTTGLGTSTATQSIGAGTSQVPVTATITGLAPGTYYFCVKATNASGTTQGSLQVFTVPSTLADAILALKRAGGLDIASPDDASHLDAPDGTPGVDLMDAVAHARRTAGL